MKKLKKVTGLHPYAAAARGAFSRPRKTGIGGVPADFNLTITMARAKDDPAYKRVVEQALRAGHVRFGS
jgi:hypothetical protein